MKKRQTLSAVLLTALIVGLAYLGISRGPVARQVAPAGPALGQAPTEELRRSAKPVVVTLPETAVVDEPFPFRLKILPRRSGILFVMRRQCCCVTRLLTPRSVPSW